MSGRLEQRGQPPGDLRGRISWFWTGFLSPQARWDNARDGALAVFLALFVLATRIPFRATHLSTWDSVLFALALDRFNIVEARPHPPGYPVYILLARMLDPVFGDPNATFVALSILFTAAAVVLLYVLVRQFGSRRAAFSAAFLFAFAPVLLENSLIATTYPGEAFFSIAIALLAWRMHQNPSMRLAIGIGALFAIAVGYRQSLLFFLAPLCAWAFLSGVRDLRVFLFRTVAGASTALAVALAWFIPTVTASGGLTAYQETTGMQSRMVVFAHTVFSHGAAAWADLWPRFYLYIQWELAIILPAIVGLALVGHLAARGLRRLSDTPEDSPAPPFHAHTPEAKTPPSEPAGETPDPGADRPGLGETGGPRPKTIGLFLGLWALPAIAFYLLIFNGWGEGPTGYILVVLPAVYLVYGLVGDISLRRLQALLVASRQSARTHPLRRSLIPVTLSVLLVLPAVPLAIGWSQASESVRDHDEWTENWLALKEAHSPETTAIVASYSWAHVKWYYPEFHVWGLMKIPADNEQGARHLTVETHKHEDTIPFYEAHAHPDSLNPHRIPDGIERVVLFDFQLAGEQDYDRLLHDDVEVHEEFLQNGWRILYFLVENERPMIEDYFQIEPHANHDL